MMRGIFWIRDESEEARSNQRENNLARAVRAGAALYGDEIDIRVKGKDGDTFVPAVDRTECDMLLACGVKNRELFRAARAAGVPWCYFDKGYDRSRDANTARGWLEFWRVSCNGHQPDRYVAVAKHDSARADEMGYRLSERRTGGEHVLVSGESGKNWWFNSEVPMMSKAEQSEFARVKNEETVRAVQALTKRPVIYRPKPSWKDAVALSGAEFARKRQGVDVKDVAYDLRRSHVTVTMGSNICFDSVLYGVPAIVLRDGIARCISSTTLDEIENPRWASEADRRQWLNNCAWCQFRLEEFEAGLAWPVIKAMRAAAGG